MRRLDRWYRNIPRVQRAALWISLLGVLIFLGGFTNHQFLMRNGPNGSVLGELLDQYYANLSAELWSIAITVFVIDRLYQGRQKNSEFLRLAQDMGSESHDFAIRGSEELRLHGYLENGSLEGMSFKKADLSGANLFLGKFSGCNFSEAQLNDVDLNLAYLAGCKFQETNLNKSKLIAADLQNAHFIYSGLADANFSYADLRGAKFWIVDLSVLKITDEQLVFCHSLKFCTMSNGKKYDGRYRLPEDIEFAATVEEPAEPGDMAKWFGVSINQYLKGQKWADRHLKKLRKRGRKTTVRNTRIRKKFREGLNYRDPKTREWIQAPRQ